jgi:D-glycero-D-manno-heptose 1,7-bisphosphate phosphatase
MLLQAAREWNIDLSGSFMIGDRITDIAAGASAGCRTILLRTGAHIAPSIETVEPLAPGLTPDFACNTLSEAATWVLEQSCGR